MEAKQVFKIEVPGIYMMRNGQEIEIHYVDSDIFENPRAVSDTGSGWAMWTLDGIHDCSDFDIVKLVHATK